ncbi:MAG: hypothetical protein ABI895_33165 [Deltaproteobacteria bacterium]
MRRLRLSMASCRRAARSGALLAGLLPTSANWARAADAPSDRERPAEPARAAPEAAHGHVLAVQASDLILDLSEAQAISPGRNVELWRPIRLRHPVTGRSIEDRFRIGTLSITQVRPHLSLAVANGELERTPAPGDVVIVVPDPSAILPALAAEPAAAAAIVGTLPAAPKAARGAPASSGAQDADAVSLSLLFESLKGRSPRERVAAYTAFTQAHPRHRHGAALMDQARQLRELMDADRAQPSARVLGHHQPPDLALVGRELSLSVQLEPAQQGMLVHYKSNAATTFQTLPAISAGRNFFAVTLPGAAVTDGGLQYFMETVDAAGKPQVLVGTSEAPIAVATRRDWDLSAPDRPAATAQFTADYADYNRLRNNDRDWRLEADFGLRLNDVGLRALRSGFGVYRGVGGTLVDLDELGKSARQVGLTYGYLEAEYAVVEGFSVIARTLLGLYADGVSGGLQAQIRIGSDRATNVKLGGEVLGNVGVRGITELTIGPESRVPIVLRSEVGNQPAGVVPDSDEVRPSELGATLDGTSTGSSDVGVRGIVQVGYRILPDLVLCARASYQGRNINHSGPGFGGAVRYSW